MKLSLLFIQCLFLAGSLMAQYKVMDGQSSVSFKAKTLGITVNGFFKGLEGNISFDAIHPEQATVKISLDAQTVNTDNGLRDSHLKEASFLNVAQYPRIAFESTQIRAASGKNRYQATGMLKIKNHAKEISFPFTAENSGEGLSFKGEFSINRKDFEVGDSRLISDQVDLEFSIHAGK